MAYFAKIDENSIVVEVISISDDNAPDPAPSNSEPLGQAFIASLGLDGEWRQTSYNSTFRKSHAGPGFRYDSEADVFIAPQPYPSWTLDADYDWQPPIPIPTEDGPWMWDEDAVSWVKIRSRQETAS